ncbi:MAG TPA: M20/M25/M40 family metallo-hydrolase [Acidisarcina sp.]|nr:M20/M25/M40 family metallo-hydrolase [Acidisarcina sp.]
MPSPIAPTAFSRIARLASLRPVHAAFQWLHLHESQIMRWQVEMVAIPAPPFGEGPRSAWVLERFRELGLMDAHVDEIGNVLGYLPGPEGAKPGNEGSAARPCILLSAHIDTVFPAETPLNPRIEGARLEAPGACDNAAGVAGLLAIAAALRHASVPLACDLLFAANVGEEGDGDLRGIRHLYQHSRYKTRIAANVVLDGAGHEVVVAQALGSRRFLVSITGRGGHSWSDAGTPNPIMVLAAAITRLSMVSLPAEPRTTVNVGTIEGGTSVNSIPERATARFDFRSTDPEQLIRMEVELHRAVEDAVLTANRLEPARPLQFTIDTIGDRPAAGLPADAAILESLRAVDRHLKLRTELRVGSTDANIPLSMGIEAISMGAGGDGGSVHTRAEWYNSAHRDLGLRRVLLLVLALLENASGQ